MIIACASVALVGVSLDDIAPALSADAIYPGEVATRRHELDDKGRWSLHRFNQTVSAGSTASTIVE